MEPFNPTPGLKDLKKNQNLPATNYWQQPNNRQSNILDPLGRETKPDISQEDSEKLKRSILLMLGHPVVKVELTDEQLGECIERAFNDMVRYAGKDLYAYTIATGGRTEYDWPSDAVTLHKVYYRPASFSSLGNVNQALFSDFYLLASDLAVDIYESPVTFWAYTASREMLEKTYGVWGSWENIDDRRFRIYPAPIKDQMVAVHYKSKNMTMNQDLYNLFRDFSLMYAKEILGRIRGKFSQLPGSNNNTIQLDAGTLLSEAREDREKLFIKLQSFFPLHIDIF